MGLHKLVIPLAGHRAWNRLAVTSLSSSSNSSSLLDEFAQVVEELRATSRRNEKFAIIKAHPRMHMLLRVLAHGGPLYLGRRSLEAAATAIMAESTSRVHEIAAKEGVDDETGTVDEKDVTNKKDTSPSSPSSSWDLIETIQRLRRRELRGRAAINDLRSLLDKYPQHGELLRDLFERRLRFGMGERLLEQALNEAASEEDGQQEVVLARGAPEHERHIAPTLPPRRRSFAPSFPITSKELPVALGFPLQHPSVRLRPEPGVHWLMSRKLDGIRCLARITKVGRGGLDALGETTVTLYSRAGKVLDHLGDIRQDVLELANTLYHLYPDLGTFYLDGELCILRPQHGNDVASITSTPLSSLTATGMDDFRTALSVVLSRPTEGLHADAHRLIFFLFDLIDPVALGQVLLSGRLDRLKTAMELVSEQRSPKHGRHRIHLLPQHCTNDPLSFRALLSEHWEGLVIRKDAPHLAKRTRDIVKVKDFYEAEFTILDWRVEPMTVIREGRHVEEPLLAAVRVQLGGNDVWVGSGLTQEERRRYAANPECLRGAQVTVRYFQESSNRRDDQVRSLRFPTIKAIYLEGGRTI